MIIVLIFLKVIIAIILMDRVHPANKQQKQHFNFINPVKIKKGFTHILQHDSHSERCSKEELQPCPAALSDNYLSTAAIGC